VELKNWNWVPPQNLELRDDDEVIAGAMALDERDFIDEHHG
jgi:hypothetical protein